MTNDPAARIGALEEMLTEKGSIILSWLTR